MLIEFFFDVSSPWTYLAFDRIVPLAQRFDADLKLKPILVGGVFNAVNQGLYEQRANPNPRKATYAAKDLADWARFQGLMIQWPSVFPVRSVLAMRACCYAQAQGKLEDFARCLFEAYWGRGEDISQAEVVAACAQSSGLDSASTLQAASEQRYKQALIDNTDALIARGGFGSPTIYLNETDMYFGNDRMELVAAALSQGPVGSRGALARAANPSDTIGHE